MPASKLNRYTLYGEEGISLPPEFVHIERIFERSSLHEWTIEPHAHPYMVQLLLLEAGSADLASDGMAEVMPAPASIFIPAACVHAFRFSPGAEGWVLSLAADLVHDPRLTGLLAGLSALDGSTQALPLAPNPATAGRLGWLLTDLALRLGQGGPVGAGLLAQVALILATFAEAAAFRARPTRPDGREQLVARYRALVEQHYREHWPVSRYAQALATTASTLTRATRAIVGLSPADIAHDRLLLEAKRNLAFTGATVAQIAYALGFADAAYFARFFKARCGMTASAFRHDRSWKG